MTLFIVVYYGLSIIQSVILTEIFIQISVV